MKFVTFYVLTFLIVWEIAGGGEFSQQDLHFIAERLNPLECSKLLKELPGGRKSERKHKPEFYELSDYWESDRSKEQCFDSLYECNERGKKGGCTKKWLVATLYKFGRADLAAGLKKRWKKPKPKKKDKLKTKHKANQAQTSRPGRTGDGSRQNNRNDTAENIVKSGARWVSNTIESEPKPDNIFLDETLVIFVATASFLILGFLATILFVAYRRACRCFRNYEEYHLQKEKKPSWHEPLKKDFGVCTNTIPDVIENPDKVIKCTKFVPESEKLEFEDEGLSKNCFDPLMSEYTKEKFLKSIREPEGTRCQPEDTKSKRKMSPCARIKRFIESQRRRSLRSEKQKESKKRKRKKKCHEKLRVKNEDAGKIFTQAEKGSNKNVRRNFKTNSSPRNGEKKGKKFRAHEKTLHRSKLTGCTCDMCRLFDVKDEEKFIDRTNNPRDRKS